MFIAYFDGASRGNPGPAGIGCVLLDAETGEAIWELSKPVGIKTNNEAEYLALIELLAHLVETKTYNVYVRGDSKLIVNQVNRVWQVKEPHLWELCVQACELIPRSQIAKLKWVPREQNRYADRLSGEALDEQTKHLRKFFDPAKLERLFGAIYVAQGTKDYAVDLENGVCTCPAFQKAKNCKHLRAAESMLVNA